MGEMGNCDSALRSALRKYDTDRHSVPQAENDGSCDSKEEIVTTGDVPCCTQQHLNSESKNAAPPRIDTGESFDDMLEEEEDDCGAGAVATTPAPERSMAATPNISSQSTHAATASTFINATVPTAVTGYFCDPLDGVDDDDFLGGDD